MFPGDWVEKIHKDLKKRFETDDKGITIVDNLEEATHAFIWVKPRQDLLKRIPQLLIGPETGITEVARINEIQKKVPTITAINMSSPWLLDNIEPNAAAVIRYFWSKTGSVTRCHSRKI